MLVNVQKRETEFLSPSTAFSILVQPNKELITEIEVNAVYRDSTFYYEQHVQWFINNTSNTQQWWHWYIMTNISSSDNQYINRFIMPWIFIFLQVWLSLMLIWYIYHRSKFNTVLLVWCHLMSFEHFRVIK